MAQMIKEHKDKAHTPASVSKLLKETPHDMRWEPSPGEYRPNAWPAIKHKAKGLFGHNKIPLA